MSAQKDISKKEKVERGSGNVFADLGFSNPEEALAKAQLIQIISETIKKRKITQRKAAALLGIDQPKVSRLVKGKISDFSTQTLIQYLNALDKDVEIRVKDKVSSKREHGRLQVVYA